MSDRLFRVLGVDYGSVRIGLAISDLSRFLANSLETYTRVDEKTDIEHLVNIIRDRNVGLVVFGLPLNMDGTESELCGMVRSFADKLIKAIDVPVKFIDERLTSVSAEEILLNFDVTRAKRKKVIDRLAATIILQNYLDSERS